jgi:hypothetical protein
MPESAPPNKRAKPHVRRVFHALDDVLQAARERRWDKAKRTRNEARIEVERAERSEAD